MVDLNDYLMLPMLGLFQLPNLVRLESVCLAVSAFSNFGEC